jgi:phosphatidylglycerol:prolipoprotein diacylglycerol transferase
VSPYFQLAGHDFPAYGVMLLLAAVLAVSVAVYFPYRRDLPRQDILFSLLYGGIGALVGAKLLYLLPLFPQLASLAARGELGSDVIYALATGGFVFFGGVFGFFGGVWIYARQYRLALWSCLETAVVVVPLAHCVGRLGCYFAGCCYGITWQHAGAVFFPVGSLAPAGVPLLPVQLYEAFGNALLFGFVFWYSRRARQSGRVLGLYLFCYGVLRFGLEFWRGDLARGIWGVFSTSQWICLLIVPCGLYLLSRHGQLSSE